MIVFLNGLFVAEEQACVSIFDRGFLYGDGLFETVRISNGRPFRWNQHLERFWSGMEFIRLHLPFSPAQLTASANELIQRNQICEALLRLTVSRGVGPRGYSPRGADRPTVAMSLHAAPGLDANVPRRWRLVTSSVRLTTAEPLAKFKTCNKLPQIIARAEADAVAADEALLLNTDGWLVEGASSNLFWIQDGNVFSPPLISGILPGITRAVVFELCQNLGLPCREVNAGADQLLQSEGVFLALSSLGIVIAAELNQQALTQSPLAGRISAAYTDLLLSETQPGV
jgi:aminodeoxychorismate lyase